MNSKRYLKYKLSYWEEEYLIKNVDFTILGAGIVGLSTAIELKTLSPKSKILIIDRKTYPIGASTKNAGFACFGSVSEILDDIDSFGEEICHKLISMRWRGLSILKNRIADMDYQSLPGIEIFDKKDEPYYHSQISNINNRIEYVLNEKNCFSVRDGKYGRETVNNLEGCLNPQKMMTNLELMARKLGVVFLQGVNIIKIDKKNCKLETNDGAILYKKLIVCTNGFSQNIFENIDIQPARNQVIVTKPIVGFSLDGCYHMNKGYIYFREVGSRLILGGGRHLAKNEERTSKLKNTDLIVNYLMRLAKTTILKSADLDIQIDKMWSGILGVGSNKMPIVKKIDSNVMVAIRMGGMGVAIGSYIGRVAASIILEEDNSDHKLFVSI